MTCEHEFVTPHRPTFYNMTSTSPTTFQTPASVAMRSSTPLFSPTVRVLQGCSRVLLQAGIRINARLNSR